MGHNKLNKIGNKMEKKLEKITDKLKQVKELFELKTAEANQANELFFELRGQAKL